MGGSRFLFKHTVNKYVLSAGFYYDIMKDEVIASDDLLNFRPFELKLIKMIKL